MKQKFEALPSDHRTEVRNEQTLRSMLSKTSTESPLPIESFACRGQSCRVVLNFKSVEQVQATLNTLPYGEEWEQSGMGFNALPENPEDPNCRKFTVYFTSSGARS